MVINGLDGNVDQIQQVLELAETAPSIALSAYQSALAQNPTGTDALTGMSLYFLGKSASGAIMKDPPCIVWLMRWMICGLCDGACTHQVAFPLRFRCSLLCIDMAYVDGQWYLFLDSLLSSSGLDHWTQASVMTLLSTCVYTPLYSCAFLAGLTVLEGKGLHTAKERVAKDFAELTSASMLTWGPINLMLFGAVESELRVAASEGSIDPTRPVGLACDIQNLICVMLSGIMFLYLIVLALWDEGFFGSSAGTLCPRAPNTACNISTRF